ncbi:MAG: adenylyl-sulfate kinase [Thermoplasmata archaeon]|nr:adenylyl-sulfate kinase [Thermoplasmata archaeon]
MSSTPPTGSPGFVLWIEGLPGSGKSTLSAALGEKLRSLGLQVEILDGTSVRQTFFPELGFSRKDREVHARRVSQLARILARNGVAVLVAMITPYETSRQAARSAVDTRFTEVWLRCPLTVCRTRDPKGLYTASTTGAVRKITGVDDPFEEPLNPDLVVDTDTASVDACTRRILEHLSHVGFFPAAAV